MEKGKGNFNINDWLEKPLKRTPGYKHGSDEVSFPISLAADGGLSTNYMKKQISLSKESFNKIEESYEINIEPMLFPQTTVPEYYMDNFLKAHLASAGISKHSFEHFKQKARLDYNQISELLSVARNTLINKKGSETFDISISEKLISLAEVYIHGFDVFGNEKAFIDWLNTSNTALGMVTPFSMLQTQYGRQEVHHVLGRIEWGVYS